jgi:fructosamine-3-kinase
MFLCAYPDESGHVAVKFTLYMNPSIQKYLNQFFSQRFSSKMGSLQLQSIGGGSINETYRVKFNGNRNFFLKLNSIARYPGLFQKEKDGLEFLANQNIINVPSVIVFGEVDNSQLLLLEWIEGGIKTEKFWKLFGEQLAALHRQTWMNKNGNVLFGLDEDNFMGSLVQHNDPNQDWNEFFVNARLQPQIKLAKENHLLDKTHLAAFEKLFARLTDIFTPEPSALLHGDLWSGNFMCNEKSEPVLIDPAVYFGHRSMDLAMTTLFGGFDKIFYEAYDYHFPFPKNYREQWEICNLYPLLIHLNLFGSGYLGQVDAVLRRRN